VHGVVGLEGVGAHSFGCVDSLLVAHRLLVLPTIPGALRLPHRLLNGPRVHSSCARVEVCHVQSAVEEGLGIIIDSRLASPHCHLLDLLRVTQIVSVFLESILFRLFLFSIGWVHLV